MSGSSSKMFGFFWKTPDKGLLPASLLSFVPSVLPASLHFPLSLMPVLGGTRTLLFSCLDVFGSPDSSCEGNLNSYFGAGALLSLPDREIWIPVM